MRLLLAPMPPLSTAQTPSVLVPAAAANDNSVMSAVRGAKVATTRKRNAGHETT